MNGFIEDRRIHQRIQRTYDESPSPQLPVTLEEARAWLRIDDDEGDAELQRLIAAATEYCEGVCNRSFYAKNYELRRDRFPVDVFYLPLGRVQSITSVQYVDNDQSPSLITWSSDEWISELNSDVAGRFTPRDTYSYPDADGELTEVIVTFVAGWTAQQIPERAKMAILYKVALMDMSRAPGDADARQYEGAVHNLLTAYKLPWA